MMVETHCHLDYLKAEPLEAILGKIKDAGIEKIITIGVDPDNLDKVRDLAAAWPQVFYTQGIHPHDARLATEIEYEKIRSRSGEEKMLAVGEIGLDYHYNNSSPADQRRAFEIQLEIAVTHDLPVVIHTREADDDTIAILKNCAASLRRKGVLHSFTAGVELAEFALAEGFFLGFNGIITFKKAENVQEIVKLTPMERILLETDSPFLAPVPHRGQENAPYHLPLIAQKVAELKQLTTEVVKRRAWDNAFQCFHKLK
jgi:TatD DNase family protein